MCPRQVTAPHDSTVRLHARNHVTPVHVSTTSIPCAWPHTSTLGLSAQVHMLTTNTTCADDGRNTSTHGEA